MSVRKCPDSVIARSVSFDKSSGHVLRRSNLRCYSRGDCEPKKQASAKNASQWQVLVFSDRL